MSDSKTTIRPEVANRVAQLIHSTIDHHVIISSREGIIIASSLPERVGNYHEFAARIGRGEMDETAVTLEDEKKYEKVRAGYNCVITMDGERIGSIGMAGDPEKLRLLTRVAAKLVVAELKAADKNEMIQRDVLANIEEVAAAAEQISAGAQQLASVGESLEALVSQVQEKVEATNTILEFINEVANKTNLLGLNAAIEAAHAGKFGAGFNVVASEIRKLAEESSNSVDQITEMLGELKESISRAAREIGQTSQISEEQAVATQSIAERIQEIQALVESLVSNT